jgi:hypothetical protein
MAVSSSHARRAAAMLSALGAGLVLMLPNASAEPTRPPGTASPRPPGPPAVPAEMRVAAGPFSGHLGISGDGVGVVESATGTLTVKIHDPNSTILSALLYSKTNDYYTISQIGFQGQTVPLEFVPGDSPACCPGYFPTYRADVTSIVADTVGSGSGIFAFTVDESVAGDTTLIDGEALYVVYEDANLPLREVYLMEGGVTSVAPEPVTVPLLSDYAGGPAKMSLGISYSAGCPNGQMTIVTVEGSAISDCAGGFDDGDALANGALITVGGWGDDFVNPAVSGHDDEKYNLAPYLTAGDSALDFTFTDPTDDDSLFVLAVVITMPSHLAPRMVNAGVFN